MKKVIQFLIALSLIAGVLTVSVLAATPEEKQQKQSVNLILANNEEK